MLKRLIQRILHSVQEGKHHNQQGPYRKNSSSDYRKQGRHNPPQQGHSQYGNSQYKRKRSSYSS